MSSPSAQLPGWTPEDSQEESSDSSAGELDADELLDAQGTAPSEPEDDTEVTGENSDSSSDREDSSATTDALLSPGKNSKELSARLSISEFTHSRRRRIPKFLKASNKELILDEELDEEPQEETDTEQCALTKHIRSSNEPASAQSSPAPSTPIRPRKLPQPSQSASSSAKKSRAAGFPLSPLRPIQELSPHALSPPPSKDPQDEASDIDLPGVEELISATQPNPPRSPKSRKRFMRNSFLSSEDDSSDGPQAHTARVGVKRQISNSPPQRPVKKQKATTPKIEPIPYIVIGSSDEENPEETEANTNDQTRRTSTAPSNRAITTPVKPTSISSQAKVRPRPRTSNASTVENLELKGKSTTVSARPPSPGPSSQRNAPLNQRHQLQKRANSYQKHEAYWHLDGNVLVQLDRTRFKLHRSILAKQSKFFDRLFNGNEELGVVVSPGNDGEPTLYDLSNLEISPHDFEEVLRALDDTFACFKCTDELPLPKLFALLRASTTFSFTIIEEYASSALSSRWSADLEDVGIDKIDFPTESLGIARRCALYPVIKRTLYELVRLPNFGQVKTLPGDLASASTVQLGQHDKDLLLSAREHFSQAWRKALNADQFPTCVAQPKPGAEVPEGANKDGGRDKGKGTGKDANDKSVCIATNRAQAMLANHEIQKECSISEYEYDPVCGLRVLASAAWKQHGFCEACVRARREYWLREREKIWMELDKWFEV